MNTKKIKKLLILNVPYILVGLVVTNVGEAWRIASGLNASEKVQSIVLDGTFATAFSSYGFTGGYCLWGSTQTGSISERKECKEI